MNQSSDPAEDRKALHALVRQHRRTHLAILMPDLDALARQGVAYDALVQTLAERGLPMTRAALSKALYRWRQRQRERAAAPGALPAEPTLGQPPAMSRVPAAAPLSAGVTSKADLAKLRAQPVDLNELASLGRRK